MFQIRFICLLLGATFYSSSAYNILTVFPLPGTSHGILGAAFVTTLLEAGHEVTYITPLPIKNPPANLRQIDVSSNFNLMPTEAIFNIEKLMKKEVDIDDVSVLFSMMSEIANHTILHENVQRFMLDPSERFDVVIVEWLYSDIYSGFGSVFSCPYIWSLSMDPHSLVLSLIDEDLNPAYTADIISNGNPPFTFSQRVNQLWTNAVTKYKKWAANDQESKIYETGFKPVVLKRGHKYTPLQEARYTGSIMLGNSHVSTGQSIRLPQNYKPIGGYHIDPKVKPLPENFQKIMDNATHGVIYFSMGSLLKSKFIPNDIKIGILKTFAELKQTVIWKFEENLPNLPANVHLVQWAPQQSILAHPNCVLFITHGGLLSTTESVHFGVPTIGIPMFADQFVNVNRAVDKGFAKRLNLNFETPVNLKSTIEDILGNPRYREKAKELSFVYHHRPVPPRVELVHWVEHVVRTRGAPHLRSPALDVTWYQKLYLDLAAFLISILLTLIYTAKRLFTPKKNIESISLKKQK